ncbi:hypothetical protein CYY_004653 [Polysphondylium violaceum]|uniref:Rab-GAP TBC domain-containing protein n=1 Tax=Polysphondylium violaceum TaxID=133409 RepID=A0A8J4V7K4_9MYCE|nr:hypothetical protein CYY_004653 [Polysphondylium violaceum]
MWIKPRPHYSLSNLWVVVDENEIFQLLQLKPNNSFFGKLANLAVAASDQHPLTYRIIYKSKPQQILAVSNSFDLIRQHWKFIVEEITVKVIDCDWDIRDQYVIPKILGMASDGEEEEADQNDQISLDEFKTQFDIDQKLVTYFTCSLWKSTIKPPTGKMYITTQMICYYTANPEFRLIIPFHRVTSISKETALGFLPSSIKISACLGPDDKSETNYLFHFILRDQAYDLLEQLWKYSMEQLFNSTSLANETNNNSNITPPSSPSISSPYQDYQMFYNNDQNNSPNLKSKTKQNLDMEKMNTNYQKIFKLPPDEELLQVHVCWIVKKSNLFGELYISPNFFCIKYKESLTTKKFTTVLHVSQIEAIQKTKPFLGFSILTDSLKILTKSNRQIIIRLFHCNEALKTMNRYWNQNMVDQPIILNPKMEKLRLETIGVKWFSKEPTLIKEDEKVEKAKFESWDKYFKKNGTDTTMSITKKLRTLIHNGIPDYFRGHLWAFCSGACFMWEKEKGYYENILKINESNTSIAIEEIEKDVRRTFAHHPYFKEEGGVNALRRVLVAYSWRNPVIGYCQGMNIIAGIMLLYMREEAAFWVLCKVSEVFLCDYYIKEMIGSIVDQRIFTDLCQLYLPEVYQHLEKIGLPVNILTLPWFMCLFVSYIPFPVSTRVVDCFFLEGTKVLFQTGLAILKINKNRILEERDSEVVVELLRNKEYDVEELIQVTFKDFDLPEEKINEFRNAQKYKEIKKNHLIQIKNNSNNNSLNNSPIIDNSPISSDNNE